MFRINKMTDYGVILLREMATSPGNRFTPGDLAERVALPIPTVSKLLKQMTQGGLLVSSRGQHGGYNLKRMPEEISMATVITVLEGPLAITECNLGAGYCEREGHCQVSGHWQQVNRAIHDGLQQLSLATIVEPSVMDRQDTQPQTESRSGGS